MKNQGSHHHQFEQLKCCVIIPTYNNEKTLSQVINEVKSFTSNVIVVNDGSTDQTKEILNQFPNVELVSYSPNAGKGNALRRGFKKAVELDYQYAITIDSDGQHKAEDLPAFLTKITQDPNSLIVGARNMGVENVPGTSSFGHKFSNFWFKFETGIDLPDTQSGFRLYPVQMLNKMTFFTTKYEFEIEVIVRAAWKGINVTSIPISVYYPPEDERVTHFRKVPDFSRVSVLNTILVFFTLIYHMPKRFLLSFKKKTFEQLFVATS